MILENKGLTTDSYFLPSFILNQGELVVVNLSAGFNYQPAKTQLEHIFCGNVVNQAVQIETVLKPVENYIEPRWRRFIWPATVSEYLKRYANADSAYATKIYDAFDWITPKTNLNRLAGTPRKQLSLFATLSYWSHISFDLVGLDPVGAAKMYEFVKESVQAGGSAILLDWTDEMKGDCTRFIEAEWF